MDDISVYRRFFVIHSLLTEIMGGLTGAIRPTSGLNNHVVSTTPGQETDVPPSLGNANTIQGARPTSSRRTRRLRKPPPPPDNAVRYKFPSAE